MPPRSPQNKEASARLQLRRDSLRGWPFFIPGLLGCVAVAAGTFEGGTPMAFLATLPVLLLLLTSLWADNRAKPHSSRENPFLAAAASAITWTAAGWLIFRLLLPAAPQAILIPAALVGWLILAYPLSAAGTGFAAAFCMEAALTAIDAQSPRTFLFNLACYAASAGGFLLMVRSRAYRHRLRKELFRERQAAEADEYARDLGLNDPAPQMANPFHEMEETISASSRPLVSDLAKALEAQLAMVREALSLTTLAILWPDRTKQAMRVRCISSSRTDIDTSFFPAGSGITGALLGPEDEISIAPFRPGLARLPYYRKDGGVGAILAIRLEKTTRTPSSGRTVSPILCADRDAAEPWSDSERNVLRLTAEKILQDVGMERRFQKMNQERGAVRKICMGLHELNGSLGLDQVLRATSQAIANLVPADFLALILTEGESCRIVLAEGRQSDGLRGRIFPRYAGLAGQTLKVKHPLPARAECFGPVRVFGDETPPLEGFCSLLVLPLVKGDEILGLMVTAATKKGVFTRSLQEILTLIASQVAVKIDLGKAHEQISRLATTDGLTGLSNHRTFQHGLGMILERARRRKAPVCLILCDIDHFKKINDTYGHPFGDKVLQGVAAVIGNAVRAVDLAARYGGEEFSIVLEDSDKAGGKKMAERIRRSISELVFNASGEKVSVTMSAGLAAWPEDAAEKAELISLADQSLYQAKKGGRNRTVAWGAETPGTA